MLAITLCLPYRPLILSARRLVRLVLVAGGGGGGVGAGVGVNVGVGFR